MRYKSGVFSPEWNDIVARSKTNTAQTSWFSGKNAHDDSGEPGFDAAKAARTGLLSVPCRPIHLINILTS